MINRVILVGRLTKDPELKYTQGGKAVCRFTLAVNRTFSNQQGEKEADFVLCVAWGKLAENIANYLRKGSLAGVDGSIQTSHYEGQDGKRKYVTEVIADSTQFLEPRSNRADQPSQQQQQPNNQYSPPNYNQQYQQQPPNYNQQQNRVY